MKIRTNLKAGDGPKQCKTCPPGGGGIVLGDGNGGTGSGGTSGSGVHST
jgi:hypothetical protein